LGSVNVSTYTVFKVISLSDRFDNITDVCCGFITLQDIMTASD